MSDSANRKHKKPASDAGKNEGKQQRDTDKKTGIC